MGAAVIANRIISTRKGRPERLSDLPRAARILSAELGLEPRTVSLQSLRPEATGLYHHHTLCVLHTGTGWPCKGWGSPTPTMECSVSSLDQLRSTSFCTILGTQVHQDAGCVSLETCAQVGRQSQAGRGRRCVNHLQMKWTWTQGTWPGVGLHCMGWLGSVLRPPPDPG